MDIQPKVIELYQTEWGRCPFEEWLEGLRDGKGRAKIRKRIDRLEGGNRGDWKTVGAGVLELKIDFGPGYRLYCAEDGKSIVLLLCGGDKSTQESDIRKAIRYWADYCGGTRRRKR